MNMDKYESPGDLELDVLDTLTRIQEQVTELSGGPDALPDRELGLPPKDLPPRGKTSRRPVQIPPSSLPRSAVPTRSDCPDLSSPLLTCAGGAVSLYKQPFNIAPPLGLLGELPLSPKTQEPVNGVWAYKLLVGDEMAGLINAIYARHHDRLSRAKGKEDVDLVDRLGVAVAFDPDFLATPNDGAVVCERPASFRHYVYWPNVDVAPLAARDVSHAALCGTCGRPLEGEVVVTKTKRKGQKPRYRHADCPPFGRAKFVYCTAESAIEMESGIYALNYINWMKPEQPVETGDSDLDRIANYRGVFAMETYEEKKPAAFVRVEIGDKTSLRADDAKLRFQDFAVGQLLLIEGPGQFEAGQSRDIGVVVKAQNILRVAAETAGTLSWPLEGSKRARIDRLRAGGIIKEIDKSGSILLAPAVGLEAKNFRLASRRCFAATTSWIEEYKETGRIHVCFENGRHEVHSLVNSLNVLNKGRNTDVPLPQLRFPGYLYE